MKIKPLVWKPYTIHGRTQWSAEVLGGLACYKISHHTHRKVAHEEFEVGDWLSWGAFLWGNDDEPFDGDGGLDKPLSDVMKDCEQHWQAMIREVLEDESQ